MKTHSGSVFLCAVFLLLCLLISCGGQKDPVGTEADRTLPVSDSGTEKDTAKDLPESTTGAAQTESSAATEEKTAQPDPEETTTDGETTGDEEATGTGSLENPPTPNAEMPVISITTDGGRGISTSDAYTVCTVSLQGCNVMYDIGERSAGIRVRGNSTAVVDKKPYRLRFDKKVNLLGLNRGAKCKNWVLLADYYDPSLMRSDLQKPFSAARCSARITSMSRFTSMGNTTVFTFCASRRRSTNTASVLPKGKMRAMQDWTSAI